MPLLTQVHRVAEIALEDLEIRVSDEQALHEFRARDELRMSDPQLELQIWNSKVPPTTNSYIIKNEQQTSWPRSELSPAAEERNRYITMLETDQASVSPLLDLADQRERADALQQQHYRVVQERDQAVHYLAGPSLTDPIVQNLLQQELSRSRLTSQNLSWEVNNSKWEIKYRDRFGPCARCLPWADSQGKRVADR